MRDGVLFRSTLVSPVIPRGTHADDFFKHVIPFLEKRTTDYPNNNKFLSGITNLIVSQREDQPILRTPPIFAPFLEFQKDYGIDFHDPLHISQNLVDNVRSDLMTLHSNNEDARIQHHFQRRSKGLNDKLELRGAILSYGGIGVDFLRLRDRADPEYPSRAIAFAMQCACLHKWMCDSKSSEIVQQLSKTRFKLLEDNTFEVVTESEIKGFGKLTTSAEHLNEFMSSYHKSIDLWSMYRFTPTSPDEYKYLWKLANAVFWIETSFDAMFLTYRLPERWFVRSKLDQEMKDIVCLNIQEFIRLSGDLGIGKIDDDGIIRTTIGDDQGERGAMVNTTTEYASKHLKYVHDENTTKHDDLVYIACMYCIINSVADLEAVADLKEFYLNKVVDHKIANVVGDLRTDDFKNTVKEGLMTKADKRRARAKKYEQIAISTNSGEQIATATEPEEPSVETSVEESEPDECIICLREVTHGIELVTFDCENVKHKLCCGECTLALYNRNKTLNCPYCRVPVPSIDGTPTANWAEMNNST